MKTALLITAIVSLTLSQSCGGSKDISSSPATPEGKYYSRSLTPVIDGKMKDWGDSLLFDNSTKLIYSISNDESALYIAVKATDRFQQMKIVQGGMEIWIDFKAKKSKSTGIKFPLGEDGMSTALNRPSGQDPKEMRQQMRRKLLTMELTGFKDGLNGAQSVYSDLQVKPVIDWDDKDDMIYEVVIPFAALEESYRNNLNNMSIGIVIKGLKMDQGSSNGMPGGGPPRGGPPGGMRPGGGNMPDRSQMENMTKEDSFWIKYTISKN
jgi:hypothetical protein